MFRGCAIRSKIPIPDISCLMGRRRSSPIKSLNFSAIKGNGNKCPGKRTIGPSNLTGKNQASNFYQPSLNNKFMALSEKFTVTVGIPAHNEEQNIKQLLTSIVSQKGNFVLEKILVTTDGC